MKTIIFFLLAFLTSIKSSADYGVSFVRIVCDQELNYLQAQYESISGSYVRATGIDLKEEKRIYDLWQRNGFYKPTTLNYECKLKNHKYKVLTWQPEPGNGHCGVQPIIKLSLIEDNTTILDHVWFGPTCYGEPYLQKLEMYNPSEINNNLKSREMYLWLVPEIKMRPDWVLLTDRYKQIKEVIPINQSKLEEQAKLVKERNR